MESTLQQSAGKHSLLYMLPARRNTVREVILHLPNATYEQLAEEAAAVHKPLEQWIVDVLTTDAGGVAHTVEPHEMLAAALDALGFERLEPEKASRLSTLLTSRKE